MGGSLQSRVGVLGAELVLSLLVLQNRLPRVQQRPVLRVDVYQQRTVLNLGGFEHAQCSGRSFRTTELSESKRLGRLGRGIGHAVPLDQLTTSLEDFLQKLVADVGRNLANVEIDTGVHTNIGQVRLR